VSVALDYAGRPTLEVSLLLTDDAEIARVHADYLGDATPTDVISFEMGESAEVVVSVETARRVAKQNGTSMRAEIALYIVHGLLHTVGFDDKEERARCRMREAERQILKKLRLRVRDVDE